MTKDRELFENLRALRNKEARKENKEIFMIFQNKTLKAIVQSRPKNIDELLAIKGIGEKKAKKYGPMVLEAVSSFEGNPERAVPEINEPKIFTVSEFIDSINEIFFSKESVIQGEVGRVENRGNYSFFSLRDKNEEAALNCFIWRSSLEKFGSELKEGLEIKVVGFPEIYKPKGNFSFRAAYLELVGEGALKRAFETLKKKLDGLGFFDQSRKKPIPRFCEKIGLITSQFADAKKDFLKHLGQYGLEVYFYDARVEGAYSICDIVSAIHWFNENLAEIDVLVLTRGGGSWESLQSFNSEAVAKAIFGSKIPVVCGVGHESDETIADCAADKRASTPTHAAKILSQPWESALSQTIFFKDNIFSIFRKILGLNQERAVNLRKSLVDILKDMFKIDKERLNNSAVNLSNSFQLFFREFEKLKYSFLGNFRFIRALLRQTFLEIISLRNGLSKMSFRWFRTIGVSLEKEKEKLKLASPEIRLRQGYSIVFGGIANKLIRRIDQLKVGDKLKIKFHRGSADSRVENIYE